jgi:hypothetical protein
MTNKSEWQEANRRITAEQREKLGDPPTAEELLAYGRGELSEDEEERIRDLLVAYPELARMYGAPFPEEPQAGVSREAIDAGLDDVKRRLGIAAIPPRGRMRHYIPTTIAAALALVFFGLYVQAESRARDNTRACDLPRVLGAPQELDPDGNRGPAAPTLLRKDGEVYFLEPHLINKVRYPHYSIELHDQKGAVWTSHSAQLGEDDAFQIVIPHTFLRPGAYQLRIIGVDGEVRRNVGAYDVAVPAE